MKKGKNTSTGSATKGSKDMPKPKGFGGTKNSTYIRPQPK